MPRCHLSYTGHSLPPRRYTYNASPDLHLRASMPPRPYTYIAPPDPETSIPPYRYAYSAPPHLHAFTFLRLQRASRAPFLSTSARLQRAS